MIRCAVCREPLVDDGPLGYIHESGSRFGPDGHTVLPVKLE